MSRCEIPVCRKGLGRTQRSIGELLPAPLSCSCEKSARTLDQLAFHLLFKLQPNIIYANGSHKTRRTEGLMSSSGSQNPSAPSTLPWAQLRVPTENVCGLATYRSSSTAIKCSFSKIPLPSNFRHTSFFSFPKVWRVAAPAHCGLPFWFDQKLASPLPPK